MALSCSYIPCNKQGEELKGFSEYRKELGYKVGSKVFTQVLSPSFQKDFKSKIELDKQGVPTYKSIIRIPYIKKMVGNTKLIMADQKKFPAIENTLENYQVLLNSAYSYNTGSDNRDSLIAVVSPYDGKIRVEIKERTKKSEDEFKNQYCTNLLNKKLENILSDLGVTVSLLENNETTNGFVDFSKALSIADGFKGLINIANGIKGSEAFSEEFAHLIVGMFRDTPLIQRCIDQLKNNTDYIKEVLGEAIDEYIEYYLEHPNYDNEGNEIDIEESLAEEALGRILQDKLKDEVVNTEEKSTSPINRLLNRFIAWVKKVFKGRNASDITDIKNSVNIDMGNLAKDILNGKKDLKESTILTSYRKAKFNELEEQANNVLKLLESASEIERKRFKITSKEYKDEIKERIIKLEAALNDKDKLKGVYNYARWALKDLNSSLINLNNTDSFDALDFNNLRQTKTVIDSYTGFIKEFHEVLDELGDENTTITIDGEDINLREFWKDLNDLYTSTKGAYEKQALSAFSDFLAPFYEKSPLKDKDGNIKNIRDVITGSEFDISEFDRWLTSMGTSSSILLQLFDDVVKEAKHTARLNTINSIRKIWSIQDKAEKAGITSFEWMFEKDSEGHKTGNYISPINHGLYKKEEEAMKKELKEKYGDNPTGEDLINYRNEMYSWYEANTNADFFGYREPNNKYRNAEYDRLTQNQKAILEEFLDYKDSLEQLLPKERRQRNRAIQRRRSGIQRVINTITDPSKAYESIKEDVKSAFQASEDDDILYGDTTVGLTDFTGKEYMTLPILYTGRLKNPDTLSTDVFSDLMSYAYMANTYSQVNKIYDPLEVGVSVISSDKFIKNEGSKAKKEVLRVLGKTTEKSVKVGDNTNFGKKLRDFLECQVYGRYFKEDDVFGKKTQKAVGIFQRLTSLAFLGCNYFVGAANVATAVGMQNIEAAAGEFFGAKELAKADAEYMKMMPTFMAELTDRRKQNKLSLFDELFDVKQDTKDKLHNVQMKNIFQRFFGKSWLYVQQGLGDHWIYNRTAIAMAMKKKVIIDGNKMSLWDALEIVTDENGYKTMKVKSGAIDADTGNLFSVIQFTKAVAHINHTLVGIYNDEDKNAAQRVILGRLMLQMRQWIIPQMMRRFQSKRMVMAIGREEEGYYRTVARLATDLWKAGFKINAVRDSLTKEDKANLRRAMVEIIQASAVWILASAVGSKAKDPDRLWAVKFAEYMLHREAHELGFLAAGPTMISEGIKTISDPFVVASAASKVAQVLVTTSNPFNWFPEEDDLLKSGPYEGHSYLYKRWMELPLPGLTQWKQIDKFLDDTDNAGLFYRRGYR